MMMLSKPSSQAGVGCLFHATAVLTTLALFLSSSSSLSSTMIPVNAVKLLDPDHHNEKDVLNHHHHPLCGSNSDDDPTKKKQHQEQELLFFQNHPDRVKSLPGYDMPLPTSIFSGYLDYELEGRQVHTHYVLMMAEDIGQDSYDDLPLIYWSNGGPGASSLFGLLTEVGPLIMSDDSLETDSYKKTGIPSPQYNPFGWTRFGHILIIDQPAPVGFSYCGDDLETHSCGGIAWTDELTSLNAYTALQTLYDEKFPCWASSKRLYLTGESYAGIYIPTLARRIYHDPNQTEMKLEGFAVGDGCLGTKTSMCGSLGLAGFVDYWHIIFMAGHHQIPIDDFHHLMKVCSHAGTDPNFLLGTTSKQQDDECKAAISKAKEELGGFFEYSLYDDCFYRNGLLRSLKRNKLLGLDYFDGSDSGDGLGSLVDGALNDYSCGGGPVMETYLRMPEVHDALHVKSTFFEVDNAEGDFDYTPTEPDLQPFYKEVVKEDGGKLRVLVYNGDTDPAITSFATQNWTSHLGFTEKQHWRPWTIDECQRMGGYVTRYENNFDFLTIRGAGHMVPTYKPEASYVFMKAWINNEDYPTFNKTCTKPTIV
eukprot:CAMPEP_0113484406 /NCGR_PEP_ID=MMETSP0014_2-20120614/23945_1 /TAXON_ID=2857 /ORGANISM="Nitzschia sp." /LENGTH=591 /DNA_ID=CAMNT_0000378007 /DNA_START=8 /DNA_END=1784 /DNA_ORIENTATION=+ /assembly_acc=CAM_ASM_000159